MAFCWFPAGKFLSLGMINKIDIPSTLYANQVGLCNEEEGLVEVSVDEVMGHINQYQMGNIDGDDLAQAIEEIVAGRIVAPGMGE